MTAPIRELNMKLTDDFNNLDKALVNVRLLLDLLVDRCRAVAEMRGKGGRQPPAANRERLSNLAVELEGMRCVVQDFITETDPDVEEKAQALMARFQELQALMRRE